jgi:Uncharacterized protein conserved in bacteria
MNVGRTFLSVLPVEWRVLLLCGQKRVCLTDSRNPYILRPFSMQSKTTTRPNPAINTPSRHAMSRMGSWRGGFAFFAAIIVAFASVAAAQQAPDAASELAAADKLYEKQLWADAEKAYAKFATSAKAPEQKYDAVRKAALCRHRRGETSSAKSRLSSMVNDDAAWRNAPNAASAAALNLHRIMLADGNAALQRETLIGKAANKGASSLAAMASAEGGLQLKNGKREKALKYYEIAVKEDKGSQPVLENIRNLLARTGAMSGDDFSDLQAVSKSAAAQSPPPPVDSAMLAALFDLLAKRPDGWKARHFQAMSLANSGKINEALAAVDSALKDSRAMLDADKKSLEELRAKIYEPTKKAKEQQAKAAAAEQEKQQEQAAKRTEQEKENPLLKNLRAGLKLQEEKRYVAALQQYNGFRSRADNSYWGRAWFNAGICLRETGDAQKAVGTWNEVWSRYLMYTDTPYGAESLLAMADAYLEDLADADNALKCYREFWNKCLQTPPSDGAPPRPPQTAIETRMAICLLALGKSSEAKAVFTRHRDAISGGAAELTNEQKFKIWQLGRFISFCEGKAPFALAQTTSPTDRRAQARLMLADSFFETGETAKARKQYELAAKMIRDSELSAYCELQNARCLALLGKADDALRAYDRLVVQYPKSSFADDALLRMGILQAGPKKNLREAQKAFERAAREYPKGDVVEAAVYYHATVLHWQEKFDDAERLYKQFMSRFPNSPLNEVIIGNILPKIAERKI